MLVEISCLCPYDLFSCLTCPILPVPSMPPGVADEEVIVNCSIILAYLSSGDLSFSSVNTVMRGICRRLEDETVQRSVSTILYQISRSREGDEVDLAHINHHISSIFSSSDMRFCFKFLHFPLFAPPPHPLPSLLLLNIYSFAPSVVAFLCSLRHPSIKVANRWVGTARSPAVTRPTNHPVVHPPPPHPARTLRRA